MSPDRSGTPPVRFVELSGAAMSALAATDLAGASVVAGVRLTDFFVTERARWLWRLRVGQIAADPAAAPWVVRAAVTDADGLVVGDAGFHGPPDATGMVEVGYAVDPRFRRRGYARAILAELLRRAASAAAVTTVRATISPDNTASLATIAGFGFLEVGEQWDDEDGLETIFEVQVR